MSIETRSDIMDFLFRELIGPDPGLPAQQLIQEEILRPQDPPRLRYSAGVLFPPKSSVSVAETATEGETETQLSDLSESGDLQDDEHGVGDNRADSRGEGEVSTEQEVNRANEYLPSALGISAFVRVPDALDVNVFAGFYTKEILPGLGRTDSHGNWQPHWFRHQIKSSVTILRSELLSRTRFVKQYPVRYQDVDTALYLHVFSRPHLGKRRSENERIITFTLLNNNHSNAQRPRDEDCFFQCALQVEASSGEDCFLEYPDRVDLVQSTEEESSQLLFSHVKTFAVGHGCAANWSTSNETSATRIASESLPAHEIKPIVPRQIDGLDLSMLKFSADRAQAISGCRALVDAYSQWIAQKETEGRALPLERRSAAERHLTACSAALERMRGGLRLLEKSDVVADAFCLMNKAMLAQQLHYDLASNPEKQRAWISDGKALALGKPFVRPDLSDPPEGRGRWRPFQLAFILMNLRSISQRTDPERMLVDLIWFPTGGGKTEAYLGLTAFAIFWRRLHNPKNAGTTALMRYTLRLLTTQQFQRAASLICACEWIRRQRPRDLGATQISIGLWVGGDVTPTKNDKAEAALQQLLRDGRDNPFIILHCPWCGAEMGPVEHGKSYRAQGYKSRSAPKRVEFACDDSDCDFNAGLPLYVVDEAIYQERPTLLIGTVDKFALLPWFPEARGLFGIDCGSDITPPDLVIQDELHLISGPLGSMVGHYETAIDELCSYRNGRERISAKIVASTATICRAEEQVHSLYGRQVYLFPPQGLKAGDSFLAREEPNAPGRMYVGVFASALSSHVTAQIRVMASLLQGVKSAKSRTPQEQDPYWTLMAYFNSLRELGHAATLIRADITDYLNAMWDRLDIRRDSFGDPRRFINADRELTSRVQNTDIPAILQELFTQWDGTKASHPIDICLATNMIQVGLDVPRLGIMTVVGQPKTTSEYIQATSRVGRAHPGLVVTVYNPSKPRDRSHYEHFRSYHEAIYRWVEPTSVTPFAVPVRDRALHALAITLVRYLGSTRARELPSPWEPVAETIPSVEEVILSRIRIVDLGEERAVRLQLEGIFEAWRRNPPPRYGDFKPPSSQTPLMFPAGSQKLPEWTEPNFPTPSSMRNVDSTCDARELLGSYPQPEEE